MYKCELLNNSNTFFSILYVYHVSKSVAKSESIENRLIVSMIVCSSSYSTVCGFLSFKQMIWSRHKNWNYFRLLEWKKISWADEKRDLFYDLHFQRTAKEKFQMMSALLALLWKAGQDCEALYWMWKLLLNLLSSNKHSSVKVILNVNILEIFFIWK